MKLSLVTNMLVRVEASTMKTKTRAMSRNENALSSFFASWDGVSAFSAGTGTAPASEGSGLVVLRWRSSAMVIDGFGKVGKGGGRG